MKICYHCKLKYLDRHTYCDCCGDPLYSLDVTNIFQNESNNLMVQKNHIFVCGTYHPHRRGTNADFDDFSQKILDLKKIKTLNIESTKEILNYF